ncbi:MAG: DoxX family protein [Acidobacteriota bacterium]|nr:DoxX family protein [Acidobacteriota bacterium]
MNASPATLQALHTLGYPLYLVKILGFAKILGAMAILYQRFPTLKEWAYAGFTFDFLGATASHLLAGDAAHAPIPFVFFALLMVSYFLWKKTTKPELTA